LGGRGRWISEFEASLVYSGSSRIARAIQRKSVSKKKKKKKKKQKKEEEEGEEKRKGLFSS
jgi:ribosomal protein L12E/L44/L45/RPP1/RPP2